jgi:hypothetical protein
VGDYDSLSSPRITQPPHRGPGRHAGCRLTSLRQTGKSTPLQQDPSLRDRGYVSLDEFAQLQAVRRDPESFLRRDKPLSVDEAQRRPELLLAIKRAVERLWAMPIAALLNRGSPCR